jgi:hypothetical protein
VTTADVVSEQIIWFAREKLTAGLGLMVIVNVSAVLEHPFAVAITEIVAKIGAIVLFVGVKTGIFPVPEAANPMLVVEFIHE